MRTATGDSPAHGVRPAIVVVTGGKGGIGTTTVAVNLAAAAAQAGTRTVLLDADLHGGDAAMLCGLPERYTLADVLAGRRTMAETLQPGPCRLQVLAGVWGYEQPLDNSDDAGRRLLEQLETISSQIDLAVLDAGNGCDGMLVRLARAAEAVLMVTTAQTPSVLGSYASIKALVRHGVAGPLHVLANRTASAAVAGDVHARLAEAARRLLGVELHQAGHLAECREVAAAGESHQPVPIAAPKSAAAGQLIRLAKNLTADLLRASSPNKSSVSALREPSVSASPRGRRYSKPRISTELEKTEKML
ncbi:MAG: P-loop NTPase [Candidatus Nealsonbacteria bacterium]|nr:P-loop NTPase [Candidatus Nealsonbacteria bacterium]